MRPPDPTRWPTRSPGPAHLSALRSPALAAVRIWWDDLREGFLVRGRRPEVDHGQDWLCRLGVHKDERKHAVDGEGYYAKCRRCGRERDISPKIGPSA